MHGLSTLNRLLGKKNKEVSRSTSNLNGNLDTSSQHNKISPIVNNAPFEQTFRVTVYLPKNQLYVERIGAKTKLKRLMIDVCDSKNLNVEKFEFRHPADMSQVFDNEQTIGEVGFNELRLVLKNEPRFSSDFHRFHADDMMKYKSNARDHSVSSSDEISRNLKNISKTSPYSSTNSLNSLDSTGMNSNKNTQQPVAPMRKKKRPAPRPPSQSSISEQQEIFTTSTLNVFKEPHSILPRKNFHVSSPQLFNNGVNTKMSDSNNNIEMNSTNRLNAITRPTSLYVSTNGEGNDGEYGEKQLNGRQRNNSESSEVQSILRDSNSPMGGGSMHNSLERRKKKSSAPVPPSRKTKPVPSPRTIAEDDSRPHSIAEIREDDDEQHYQIKEEEEEVILPQQQSPPSRNIEEIPRLDNNANHKIDDNSTPSVTNTNVSKVLLNNSIDAKGERDVGDGQISIQIITETSTAVEQQQQQQLSKENESRVDEIRSSSDEDEGMKVNIYNITTKSVVSAEKSSTATPPTITKETSSTTRQTISVVNEHVEVEEEIINTTTTTTTTVIEEERQRSPSPNWTYTLPAPPVFTDSSMGHVEKISTSPTDHRRNTTISEFTADNETILSDSNTTTMSAETKIHPIILKRRKTIEESRYPAGMKDDESDKSTEIITSDLEDGYLGNHKVGSADVVTVNKANVSIKSDSPTPGAEKNRMEERELIVDDFQRSRLIITRSDSFHSIGQQKKHGARGVNYDDIEIRRTNGNAMPQRSTSFLSLKAEIAAANKFTKNSNGVPYSKQKSTSELSISDVPSLQSLEVIKNILNSSRKNSLQDSSSSALNDDVTIAPAKTVVAKGLKKSVEADKPKAVIVEENKKEVIRQLETQLSEPMQLREVKNPVTKNESKWRYSGPPKINFSTWSERPKGVEVAVMNDSDYIFGKQNSTNSAVPRDSTKTPVKIEPTQTTTSVLKKTEIFASKPISTTTTTLISGTEKQHMPPKVLGVEYKKDVSNTSVINIKARPVSVDYSTSILSNNNSSKNASVMTAIKPINSANYQNSSTTQFVSYNRLSTNHKKFTPIVHGFKLDNISETKAQQQQSATSQINIVKSPIANKISDINEHQQKKAEAPIIPTKPSFLRSTSGGDFSQKMKIATTMTPSTVVTEDSQHFSQTLRRTGELEKILSNDNRTASIFGKVIDTPASSQTDDESVKVKLRQSSSFVPTPPTLPPAMIFRKSAPAGEILIDPRNQLLDAIKNFNVDSLRRK